MNLQIPMHIHEFKLKIINCKKYNHFSNDAFKTFFLEKFELVGRITSSNYKLEVVKLMRDLMIFRESGEMFLTG